jgi:hypothetical protein
MVILILFGAEISLIRKEVIASMKQLCVVVGLLSFCFSVACAQQTVFDPVKIRRHRSTEKRVLVDKLGL